ncbi:hypothetical protein BurJ1DRAFT_0133 [Burkholderiales bacterium JOSHI_001]|nr:hypothetical protein BurJ1DRAFT_0133 [Burkholderiales bacterium JOSHI_001]
MRNHPTNSPAAAARILALALVSDGHVSKAEIEHLDALQAHRQLGLEREELHAVLHSTCEDLMHHADLAFHGSARLDEQTLGLLLDEVSDPALRWTVLQLCFAIVSADGHLADGESVVIDAALERWGVQPPVTALVRHDMGAQSSGHRATRHLNSAHALG